MVVTASPDQQPPPGIGRRSVLRGLGTAGLTVLVAGTGVAGYRAYDNGVLDPGAGAAYDAWGSWRSDPGPAGAALTSGSDPTPGIGVRWFDTPGEKATMGALLLDAARAVVEDVEQSSEAFAWFRNDRDAIDRHRDGLTLDGQGLAPVTLALGKLLPATSRSAGDQFWFGQTETARTATAAAYGVVTVADTDDVMQRLEGGRLLQSAISPPRRPGSGCSTPTRSPSGSTANAPSSVLRRSRPAWTLCSRSPDVRCWPRSASAIRRARPGAAPAARSRR